MGDENRTEAPGRRLSDWEKEAMIQATKIRVDQLENLVMQAVTAAREASVSVHEHIVKCDGRDGTNTVRYDGIHSRLGMQDKLLWAIISVLGACATGIAIAAWDIIKAKMGL